MWLYWPDEDGADRRPDAFVDYGPDGDLFVKSWPGKQRLEGRFRGSVARESLLVCVVGFSYPACRLIPVLEFGLRLRGSQIRSSTEGGLIVNLGEHHGVGLAGGGGDEQTLGGRYRFWMLENIAAEAGVARLYTEAGDGWRGHVSVVLADALTGFAAIDLTAAEGEREWRGVVGVKVGLPALLVAGAAAITGLSLLYY